MKGLLKQIHSLEFQIELENLNTATDEINKLEIELEVIIIVLLGCINSVMYNSF